MVCAAGARRVGWAQASAAAVSRVAMVLAACVFTGFRYNARTRRLQLVTLLLQLAGTREAIRFTQGRNNVVSSESPVRTRIAAHFGDAVVGRGGRRRHSRAL